MDPQKVSFHVGDLDENKFRWKSEGFHRMIQNMREGDFQHGDHGYGIVGTGVYYTDDVEDITIYQDGCNRHGYAINVENYNLLHFDDDRSARGALDFLSYYQGYVIYKGASFEEFEQTIQEEKINLKSLYELYTAAFSAPHITYDDFEERTREYIAQVQEAAVGGIDPETGLFTDLPEKFDHADNVNTQFMKSLGYEGIDLRGTSYDGYEYGSVVFDLREGDIEEVFETNEQMIEYSMKLMEMRVPDVTETIELKKPPLIDMSVEDRFRVATQEAEVFNAGISHEATIESNVHFHFR